MANQLDDVLTFEPLKRSRGRPSTGKARSSAERMRELRARQRVAVWGSAKEAKGITVTVTGLLEQLRYAVATGQDAVAQGLCNRLVQLATENKSRHSDRKGMKA